MVMKVKKKKENMGEDDLQPLLNVLHRGCWCGEAFKFWGLLYLRIFQYNLKVNDKRADLLN